MGDSWGSLRCKRCRILFEDLDAYDRHVGKCTRPTEYVQPKFRSIDPGLPVQTRAATFGPSAFDDRGDDVARWTSETQVEAVDAGLRSGRIRRVSVEEQKPERNALQRMWARLTRRS